MSTLTFISLLQRVWSEPNMSNGLNLLWVIVAQLLCLDPYGD